ncbi:MAG: hypothetical protein AAF941_00240 [Pseudomonadota bacterium]
MIVTLANTATMTISEMREFASFAACEQRYIKRSLDIGLARCDAFKLWGRSEQENTAIRRQYVAYQDLKALRDLVPQEGAIGEVERLLGKLVRMTVFDLEQEKVQSFSAFRFLYERLLGPGVRPYLPAAFCAAAALPQIRPEQRKMLLQSLSEAAATAPGWSDRAPSFYPEYVEEAEAA